VNNWTKRTHVTTLAGLLQSRERDIETMALFEAAYEKGWLTQSVQLVALASYYMNAQTPFKAAQVLQEGLDDGTIESSLQNWRMLAQAWQLAAEHEKALPALEQASELADDGEIDRQLAQSLASLAQWEECATASRTSLNRGVDRVDFVNMQLGQCLVNLRQYDEARRAFEAATRDDRSATDARRWLRYIETELARERANAEALASLQANRE
jgi:tetratricopeptide (TPR) repeat protein